MGRIPNFFRHRSIFITGSSGLVGKVLVEKILRACPEVGNIYVLLRGKKGLDVENRISQIKSSFLFERLRKEHPDALGKLVPVAGDLTKPGLGLSVEDREMLQRNVSIVFHSAATVNLNEKFNKAIEINIVGTRRVLDLCKEMSKLKGVVHISTCYSNCIREEIEETIYPVPIQPDALLELAQKHGDKINLLTSKLLGTWPNTYTFTKAVSEKDIEALGSGLPIAIARPSVASLEEPIPGWVDTMNTMNLFATVLGLGTLRTVLIRRECRADIIPVDILGNMLIAIAWRTASSARCEEIPVYHCSSHGNIRYADTESLWRSYMLKNPLKCALWYPETIPTENASLHKFSMLLFNILPTKMMEIYSKITGVSMSKIINIMKISRNTVEVFEYFVTRGWKFSYGNIGKLEKAMTEEDRTLFRTSTRCIDWEAYLRQMYIGTKQFILKEEPYATQETIQRMARLKKMHRVMQITLLLLLGLPSYVLTSYI